MESNSPKTAMDVTGLVDVTDPASVRDAVKALFENRYPGEDVSLLDAVYRDFAALYRGEFPGYEACDTSYHDMQHVLDVSLAMARLIDGYEINHDQEPLGLELALMGVVLALFHDAGYIRRSNEDEVREGAEYTKIHVTRSASFMAAYLPTLDLSEWVPHTTRLVHFTGYEILPDSIPVRNERMRTLGCLVGTADVIAQMADYAYLEKCRDRLYPEFVAGGMTRQVRKDGSEEVIYASAQELLEKTPEFIKNTITERLNGHFCGLYRNVEAHFGGRNYYMEALESNCRHLEDLLAQNDPALLQQSPLRPEQ